MDKLLLVDGSNLLFQMFYGMPARIVNEDGRAIQGTLGVVGALLKIIRMVQPTCVAVLFDGEHENPRIALDEQYKANRPDYNAMPEEDTPFSQLPDIYDALDFMGLCHAETVDCEADDWIAGYVRSYGAADEIVIASMDSDFFQLIGEHVRVLRYRGKGSVVCGREYVAEKFGVEPEQYADWKALVGDSADHIPGIRGVGPKTAAALLAKFGSLDGILAGVEEIERPSLRATIAKHSERLRINLQLIGLEGTKELPFDKKQIVWTDEGLTTTQVLRGIGLRRDVEEE